MSGQGLRSRTSAQRVQKETGGSLQPRLLARFGRPVERPIIQTGASEKELALDHRYTDLADGVPKNARFSAAAHLTYEEHPESGDLRKLTRSLEDAGC
jgi:hypothetical protein